MFKTVLKVMKWICLFWVFLLVAGLATGLIGGLLAGIFGIEVNISLMLFGFTAVFMTEAVLKSRRKQKKKQAQAEAARKAEEAYAQKNRMKNETAVRLDAYRVILERHARKIRDSQTGSSVKRIAILLHNIAREVEADPRDRSKARSLADHSAGMICDLVDKYIKLESQNQESSNIASTMWEIRSALGNVENSLKTLLDDMFRNDVVEVAANISVLENILSAASPENRISMEDVAKAVKEAETSAAQTEEVKPLESV